MRIGAFHRCAWGWDLRLPLLIEVLTGFKWLTRSRCEDGRGLYLSVDGTPYADGGNRVRFLWRQRRALGGVKWRRTGAVGKRRAVKPPESPPG